MFTFFLTRRRKGAQAQRLTGLNTKAQRHEGTKLKTLIFFPLSVPLYLCAFVFNLFLCASAPLRLCVKKKYGTLFIFSLSLPFLLSASPIHVQLSSAFQPEPLYLLILPSDNPSTPELEKTLRFDIAHNGKNVLVKNNPDLDALLTKEAFTDTISYQRWKERGVAYCIALKITNKTLSVQLIDIDSRKTYLLQNLPPQRSQIHFVTDQIMQLFFDMPGFASSKLLFTVKQRLSPTNELSSIWESDYDGANARKLISQKALCVTPYASKDKDHFFFVSYASGQPKIEIGSKKLETSLPFLRLRGQQMMPALNPDQKSIAFISDATGNPDLFLVEIDRQYAPTSKPRQIYGNRFSTQGSPTFSPDGKKIVFVSNQDGIARLYLMDIPAEGTSSDRLALRLLTKRRVASTAPVYSPDGKKIAYTSQEEGFRQIWIYDFATAQEQQLTTGPLDKENPTWAPDSLHLIYNAGSGEDDDLYLIDLNNKRPVRLTQTKGATRFPFWEK